MKYRYTYTGTQDVHLPQAGITAQGGDTETVYEVAERIDHPDFVEVKRKEPTKKPTK